MLFYKYNYTIEIASGVWSGNTDYLHGGFLKHAYLKSTSLSTVFDFAITDSDDNIIFSRKNIIGLLNESLELTMVGIHTLAISNSSADEDFNIKLMIRE